MKQLCDILFLQTFGIILVVLGHSFYQFPSDTPFIRWIYGFHMPLFFFISGYLLKYVHGDLPICNSLGAPDTWRARPDGCWCPMWSSAACSSFPRP